VNGEQTAEKLGMWKGNKFLFFMGREGRGREEGRGIGR
jgi:hypothetical protein